jgi:Family of unknown function (DUF6232)
MRSANVITAVASFWRTLPSLLRAAKNRVPSGTSTSGSAMPDALALSRQRQPLTTITGAQRASGQTHSRVRCPHLFPGPGYACCCDSEISHDGISGRVLFNAVTGVAVMFAALPLQLIWPRRVYVLILRTCGGDVAAVTSRNKEFVSALSSSSIRHNSACSLPRRR